MPIIKSAKKRVRQAQRATVRNLKTRRNMKSAVKTLQKAIASGKKSSGEELKQAQSAIDQAVKKNIIHKNKAARKKRQLARAAKAAGIGVAVGVAAAAKKSSNKSKASKKLAPKKSPVKKPAATKKAPAKKSAAKKKTTPKK